MSNKFFDPTWDTNTEETSNKIEVTNTIDAFNTSINSSESNIQPESAFTSEVPSNESNVTQETNELTKLANESAPASEQTPDNPPQALEPAPQNNDLSWLLAPETKPEETQAQTNMQVDPLNETNNNQYFKEDETINDDELFEAFIGKNYKNFKESKFNTGTFFWGPIYYFYRKMYVQGILYLIIYYIILLLSQNMLLPFVTNLIGCFLANSLYLIHVSNKIENIKNTYKDATLQDLKDICEKEGGTSFLFAFIGCFVATIIFTIIAIIGNGINSAIDRASISKKESYTIKDVTIENYTCLFSNCIVSIKRPNGNIEEFELQVDNKDLFIELDNYEDDITIDISFVQTREKQYITGYKIYKKETKEELKDINSINDLKDKLENKLINKSSIKTFTEELTFIGVDSSNDNEYIYSFINENNETIKLKYIKDNRVYEFVEGTTYNITYEVNQEGFTSSNTLISVNY